jgi:V8-like Glu-specific endopeptidase
MNADFSNSSKALARVALTVAGCALGAVALAAQPGVKQNGAITSISFADAATQLAHDSMDYVNARPKALPIASNFSPETARAELIGLLSSVAGTPGKKPGFVRGQVGDGQEHPMFLGTPAKNSADDGGVSPQEFGTSNLPFSTSRADGQTGTTNKTYPFRASGKLFFNEGPNAFICSASLLAKGLVVTAAHCVADFGKNTFHTNYRFVPGYKSGSAPYGSWTAKAVYVLAAYANGTDSCAQSGVICKDDVALIVLNAQSGRYPGTNTGFYSYGFDGYGFTSNKLTEVTQIGYPACLDNGEIMERTDSQGATSASNSNNTLIGSLMCGGSSGGPWLVNFGRRPNLTGTTSGTYPLSNTVIGTTSWGSTATGPKNQGAAPFLSTNIKALVTGACGANAGAC